MKLLNLGLDPYDQLLFRHSYRKRLVCWFLSEGLVICSVFRGFEILFRLFHPSTLCFYSRLLHQSPLWGFSQLWWDLFHQQTLNPFYHKDLFRKYRKASLWCPLVGLWFALRVLLVSFCCHEDHLAIHRTVRCRFPTRTLSRALICSP